MDWNSSLPAGDGRDVQTLLAPGDYWFRVLSCERGTSKDQKSPQAKLKLWAGDFEGKTLTVVWERLTLRTDCAWRLSEFFVAIGLKKKDETYQMAWDAVPGAFGMATIERHIYEGKQTNRVKAFLSPVDAPPPSWAKSPPEENQKEGELPF